MTVLRLEDASGTPIGMIDWFAVHGTSMNNTNLLISGDNKGFASWYVERLMNGNKLPGKGKFVAAFGQWFVDPSFSLSFPSVDLTNADVFSVQQ